MISSVCLVISLFVLPIQNLHMILGQSAQTTNSSNDAGLINATNGNASITNALNNATSNITKNLNASITNALRNPVATKASATPAVNTTAAIKVIVDSNLPYVFIFVVFFILIIPLVLDLWLAYRRKAASTDKDNARITGIPGLYRALMTFGVILLVGTVIFYILALITLNINAPLSPALQSLVDLLKNLGTILGTALASIIAFYFGMRGAESAAEKAVTAAKPSVTPVVTGTPSIVSISPNDGASAVAVDSDIRVVFSEPVDKTTVNISSFSLKDSNNQPKIGTVSLSPDDKTVTFRPDTSLSANTTYHVTVSGVKVAPDLRLIPTKTWSFTTK